MKYTLRTPVHWDLGAELVVIPGGFAPPDPSDEAYERNLKDCRLNGHRLFWFVVDGLDVGICARCETKFREVVE